MSRHKMERVNEKVKGSGRGMKSPEGCRAIWTIDPVSWCLLDFLRPHCLSCIAHRPKWLLLSNSGNWNLKSIPIFFIVVWNPYDHDEDLQGTLVHLSGTFTYIPKAQTLCARFYSWLLRSIEFYDVDAVALANVAKATRSLYVCFYGLQLKVDKYSTVKFRWNLTTTQSPILFSLSRFVLYRVCALLLASLQRVVSQERKPELSENPAFTSSPYILTLEDFKHGWFHASSGICQMLWASTTDWTR